VGVNNISIILCFFIEIIEIVIKLCSLLRVGPAEEYSLAKVGPTNINI